MGQRLRDRWIDAEEYFRRDEADTGRRARRLVYRGHEGGKIGEQEPWLDALPPCASLTHFYCGRATRRLPSGIINAIQGKPTTCCSDCVFSYEIT